MEVYTVVVGETVDLVFRPVTRRQVEESNLVNGSEWSPESQAGEKR